VDAPSTTSSDSTSVGDPYGVPAVRVRAVSRRAQRGAALAEVFAVSGFPTQILLGLALALAGMPAFQADGRLSLAYLVTLWLADTTLMLALVFWLLRAHGESPTTLFLGGRRMLRELLLGIALVPVAFGLVAVVLLTVQRVAPWLHNVPQNPFEQLIVTRRDAMIVGAVSVISGGLREELQRAFILRRFEQHLGGAAVGLAVFSILFGAGHAIQGWDVAVTTLVLGAFWGGVYLWRRSTIGPILSHSGFNLIEVIRYSLLGP
jgi:membrane protease YdiL (CAAX protease family)